ncbi:hypothetical protein BDP27DRAFT_1374399 [Rhodocollybia butyracea]|uniref:Uncharacterized protein n=1 Tax=Rhodocollybia butyracea TaxID=206335 RepID=A0A9P5TW15_9AGAR|nr:hypothetical protein BDP27DRAFT_1374399 [Rhodocollybia butyracea]
MSVLFHRRLPPDQPPPCRNSIVHGKRTPLYGLAWVCSPHQLSKNLGGVPTGRGKHRDVISAQWKGPFSYELSPSAVFGMDGNYYLVAEWNEPHPGHTSEAIIEAARKAVGVDKDVTLEATLQWYRFPLTWLVQEEREKEKLALKGMEKFTKPTPWCNLDNLAASVCTVLKYNEPPEARKLVIGRWLYVFKAEAPKIYLEYYISKTQSTYLIGETGHPSCSKKHAAIHTRRNLTRALFANIALAVSS